MKLHEKAIGALQPFFPGLDLAAVDVKIRIPRLVRWFGAVSPTGFAGFRRIYFAEGQYDPDSVEGLARIAHELKHVEQYRRYGRWTLPRRYVAEYLGHRRAGMGRYDAYRNVSFEREAYGFEEMVLERLRWRGGDGKY